MPNGGTTMQSGSANISMFVVDMGTYLENGEIKKGYQDYLGKATGARSPDYAILAPCY
jgi:hypothetical protein